MVHKSPQDYQHLVIKPENMEGMFNVEAIFGRTGALEMEVGSGKGTFLLEQARAFPETLFIGIEWANKFYKYAVDRLGRWNIENVRLMRTDASDFIRRHMTDASICMFHLYFPDPWPKKKHNKRRFFCDENMAQLERILQLGGVINMATDHEDYYVQMREVADKAIAAGRFEEIEFIRPAGARDGETVGTNYERKYMKEGRRTYTLALRKKT